MTSLAAPRAVRVLTEADRPEVEAVLANDPVRNVFVASRVDSYGIGRDPGLLGASLWGYYRMTSRRRRGPLQAVCFAGANLIPVNADVAATEAFADRARVSGRMCSSIVGDAGPVLHLWERLREFWDAPREVRPEQPVLVTSRPPSILADPRVRLATPRDFDALLPACVAMYTEEVGVSPLDWDGGRAFRGRLGELIADGHMYVRCDESGVVDFKAEIGAVSHGVCQIQGVWVRPELRGRGVGTAAMAAVTADAVRRVAPVASLYVNGYNHPARAVYERCGFVRHATFATVLF